MVRMLNSCIHVHACNVMYILMYCICLADNEALRTLDLSWNHIRKKGAVAVATSLKVFNQLHVHSYAVCTRIIKSLKIYKVSTD